MFVKLALSTVIFCAGVLTTGELTPPAPDAWAFNCIATSCSIRKVVADVDQPKAKWAKVVFYIKDNVVKMAVVTPPLAKDYVKLNLDGRQSIIYRGGGCTAERCLFGQVLDASLRHDLTQSSAMTVSMPLTDDGTEIQLPINLDGLAEALRRLPTSL